MLLSLFSVILFVSKVQSQVECHDPFECLLSNLVSTSENIECYGSDSCRQSIISSNSGSVKCHGSKSCFQATSIASGDDLECYGLLACEGINSITTANNGWAICRGEESCFGSDIVVSGLGRIICDGLSSCASGDFTSSTSITVRAALGAARSVLRAGDNSVSYTFGAHEAAQDTEIICIDTCFITCYSGGCNGLILTCASGPGTCAFNVNCDDAAKSTVCQDGYELPTGFELPSLLSKTFTTISNSQNVCNAASTGALHCDEFGEPGSECYNIGALSTTNAPICCTGAFACALSTSITANIDPSDLTFVSTAFRADGYFSADDIVGSINAPGGGDIYLAGSEANYDSSSDFRTTFTGNGNYDMIISGYAGTFQEKFIDNIRDLYCLTADSCRDITGSNINGNVYAYGWRSLELDSSLTNVGGDIYCSGASACNGLTVDKAVGDIYGIGGGIMGALNAIDVGGSIVGYGTRAIVRANLENIGGDVLSGGFRALYQSSIINVASVVCEGLECLAESTIRGLGKLEVDGDSGLDNSVIISEAGNQDNMFSLIVDGTNIAPYDVYCNATDTCDITCLSADACGTMNLICLGRCTLNCDLSFNCPDVPVLIDPTSEPTEEPNSR